MVATDVGMIGYAKTALSTFNDVMFSIFFYEIGNIPFVVLWLICAGIFFTFRLGFLNVKLFGHGIKVVMGKYSKKDDPGEVTHMQALSAAVSATVGLGNIAGVAVAVSLGGPGAVIWMMLAAFLGMSTKFAEVTLGHKYRNIDENGKVTGGAFYYLKEGLAEINLPKLGKIMAVIFAVLCIGSSLGSGNMFQANQSVALMVDNFSSLADIKWVISLILAISVGVVLIGGIKRIAKVAEAVVPLMAFIYILAALVIIISHYQNILPAISIMFEDAFTGEAVGGGMIGALVNGVRRAAFSNEAGAGSAPIAHAAAKTTEPVREGCVAILEPFIDTIVICFMTGLLITVTGVYMNADGIEGVTLTASAFATVAPWFPYILSIAVFLFAYSTMITWSYYGERSWRYLFGPKYIKIYQIIFVLFVFLGGVLSNLNLIIDFSDVMFLTMSIPNLIGVYLLTGVLVKEVKKYRKKMKI